MNEPGSASGMNDPIVPESPFIKSSQPSQPSSQQKTDGELELLEYEDQEDYEPEELRRQKECEAPTERQRREHIESNHSTYRDWCDVCIKARATGTPHAVIKSDLAARREAEREGPRFYSDFYYMSSDETSMPMLALKFSRSGRLSATALPSKGVTEFGVKWFARFIQSTGVRKFINHSDNENA